MHKINAVLAAVAIAGLLATPATANAGRGQKALEAAQAEVDARSQADADAKRAKDQAWADRRARDDAKEAAQKSRKECESAWQRFETSKRREGRELREIILNVKGLEGLDIVQRPSAWGAAYASAFAAVIATLEAPANLDQVDPFLQFDYVFNLTKGAPACAAPYEIKAGDGIKEHGPALNTRFNAILDLVNAELEREAKLDKAHSKKLFAALRRAGCKGDAWFNGVGSSVSRHGIAAVRGRAAWLEVEDSEFALIQVIPGVGAVFAPDWDRDDDRSFTIIVTGIPTRDLMHGSYLTDLGFTWAKIVGLKNYRNALGTQAQGIVIKPLRKIPNPERNAN